MSIGLHGRDFVLRGFGPMTDTSSYAEYMRDERLRLQVQKPSTVIAWQP